MNPDAILWAVAGAFGLLLALVLFQVVAAVAEALADKFARDAIHRRKRKAAKELRYCHHCSGDLQAPGRGGYRPF